MMVVYEISAPDLEEPVWVLTLDEAAGYVLERQFNTFSVHRLTLRERFTDKELRWAMKHRDAYVVNRDVVA